MVTPIARRRPQVLARQAVALDHVSGGRLVLGVGLGLDASGDELSRFGEEVADRTRAEMLDEGLALLQDLFSGGRVDHDGDHYTARDVTFQPTPVTGRIPIWVAARWPNVRPLRRAARHDGLFIIDIGSPSDLAAAVDVIREHRNGTVEGFDVAVELDDAHSVDEWGRAGATWGLAQFDPFTVTESEVRERIGRGPGA
jgi:alkanesulfonate monooxygenase SsuD/methylene tetrahydromethanopterin reductase-like flavin-dependent oxidoreductase (luciferase family)